MNRILIVEDNNTAINEIIQEFEKFGISKDRIDVAKRLSEAYEHIGEFSNGVKKYVAITLDGTLEIPGKSLGENTIKLCAEISQSGYEGLLIAASNDDNVNNYLLRRGCTHAVPNFKYQVAELIANKLKQKNINP